MINGGTPKYIAGLFHGKFQKWMRTGDSPMDWKPPYGKRVKNGFKMVGEWLEKIGEWLMVGSIVGNRWKLEKNIFVGCCWK
jgi:hypothetical protein